MRIIKGEFAGRFVIAPKSRLTRPTSDKVRQAIFNILAHNSEMNSLEKALVLDVFAGSGALGFEALSRGAEYVTLVDSQRVAYLNMNNITRDWNVRSRVSVQCIDVLKLPKSNRVMDVVFCDPPYRQDLVGVTCQYLRAQGWVNSNTLIIAEMHRKGKIDFNINLLQEKLYGDTKVLFFKVV